METQRATSHDVEAKQHSSLNRSSSPSVFGVYQKSPWSRSNCWNIFPSLILREEVSI